MELATPRGEEASDASARRELWTSFISVVRSYIAATQVGSEAPSVLVDQPSFGEVEVVAAQRTVRLIFDADTAEGYWTIHRAASDPEDALLADGAFRIGLDGRLDWTGIPGRPEMDAVAEALATLIFE